GDVIGLAYSDPRRDDWRRRASDVTAGRAAAALTVAVVDTLAALARLEGDWTALAERDGQPGSAARTFAYALAGARTLPRGAALAVATATRAGRLVGVWPLFVQRRGSVRVATHLGNGSDEEYAGPLVDAREDGAAVSEALLGALKGRADVVRAYNLAPSTPVARGLRWGARLTHRSTSTAHVITLRGQENWDAWFRAASPTRRKRLGYFRRKLMAQGALELAIGGADHLGWLFATKRRWLAETGRHAGWIEGGRGEAFFRDLIANGDLVQSFTLTLDGRPIAGCACLTSRDRLEYFLTTIDPAFEAFSPGQLLIEACGRWALERGLDFDLRIMDAGYKDRWADRAETFDSFAVALTPLGVAAVCADKARAGVKAARRAVGPRAKALIARAKGRGRSSEFAATA
ncbi:MAG: GNAT family N-acetyltransferase, partial [Caulobacteraceae bacterium]|nr:GNAT family N-acetyltransferase [Caulobacteraceae bacterium]